jgi:hypothetical protein
VGAVVSVEYTGVALSGVGQGNSAAGTVAVLWPMDGCNSCFRSSQGGNCVGGASSAAAPKNNGRSGFGVTAAAYRCEHKGSS